MKFNIHIKDIMHKKLLLNNKTFGYFNINFYNHKLINNLILFYFLYNIIYIL